MKNRFLSAIWITSLCLVLCACQRQKSIDDPQYDADIDLTAEIAASDISPSPPSVVLTPAPTPAITEVTLTCDDSAEYILSLRGNDMLKYVDASASTEYDAIVRLYQALPESEIYWEYASDNFYISSQDSSIALASVENIDIILNYFPEIKTIDLTQADVDSEFIDYCMNIRPDIDYIWTMKLFGEMIQTDIQCYSTLKSIGEGLIRYSDEDFAPLFKYCKHLRALDLGHNNLIDLTPIGTLSELQVLIIADQPNLVDISPLAQLSNLMYLEMFMCYQVEDFTPLSSLTKMQYINISKDRKCTDCSFLESMPDLKMAWLRDTGITKDMVADFPDVEFLIGYFSDPSSTSYGWRSTDCNIAIRKAFTNWRKVVYFNNWSDILYIDDSQ